MFCGVSQQTQVGIKSLKTLICLTFGDEHPYLPAKSCGSPRPMLFQKMPYRKLNPLVKRSCSLLFPHNTIFFEQKIIKNPK
jgi:hypothetical protein